MVEKLWNKKAYRKYMVFVLFYCVIASHKSIIDGCDVKELNKLKKKVIISWRWAFKGQDFSLIILAFNNKKGNVNSFSL